ncbi:TPA: SelB C-terminal domain-containing protein, partial [Serratia marcescens]|nr:SelB C-terminal domain-containing protein [Serratia marcescens]
DAQVLTLELPHGALSLTAFAWARQLTDDGLAALLANRDLLIVGDRALAQDQVQQAESRLLQVLAEYHQQHADQLGLGRARLRRMALPQQPETLVFMMIDRLLKAGALRNTRGWLHLPEHGLAFSAEEAPLWARIEPLFGDEPWWVRDLASELGEEESRVRALLRKAAQLGHVTAVVVDRYYLSRRIEQFAALIRELDAERGGANAADFRDRLGVGRKLAIQVLEFFDRSGFTRRKGNEHLLRDGGLFGN